MKLSRKGEYALRALIDLGIAAEVGRDLLQVSEIAAKARLPAKFLEQAMQQLKQAELVASVRGKFGGYRLARPASEIRIGEVVRLIDGPLAPIGCVSQCAYEPCSCPDETHCGLRMIMLDVRNAIAGILDRYSLGDVVEVTLRKMRRDGLAMPYANPGRGDLPASAADAEVAADRARPSLEPMDGLLHHLIGNAGSSAS